MDPRMLRHQRRYYFELFHLVLGMVGDTALTNDIIKNAFAQLEKKLNEDINVGSFLVKAVRDAAMNHLKSLQCLN